MGLQAILSRRKPALYPDFNARMGGFRADLLLAAPEFLGILTANQVFDAPTRY